MMRTPLLLVALLLSTPNGDDAFATVVRTRRPASGFGRRRRRRRAGTSRGTVCRGGLTHQSLLAGGETSSQALSAWKNEDDRFAESLLDESVLLYAKLAREFLPESEVELDLVNLRKRELSQLIQDTVVVATTPDGSPSSFIASSGDNDGSSVVADLTPETERNGPQSVREISVALDQAILQGYQSSFSEGELAEWVEGIESLYKAFQIQTKRLQSADERTRWSSMKAMVPLETPNDDKSSAPEVTNPSLTAPTANVMVSTTNTNVELQNRLENLRTLIDPIRTIQSRRIPVVGYVGTFSAVPETENVPATATWTNVEPSGFNDMREPHATGAGFRAGPISSQESNNLLSSDDEASYPSPNQAPIISTDDLKTPTKLSAPTVHSYKDKYEGNPDVLSAILSVAFIGAAAVTQIPLFVAGVALGPAIRDYIAYARKKTKEAPKLTPVAESSAKGET